MKMNRMVPALAAALVAGSFGLAASQASAQTEVVWLHTEQDPGILSHWEKMVADFEASHSDVDIVMQFLENEAFKAKLTTMLQSDARPDIFYSWGGGVMQAQVDAGVLRPITGLMTDDFTSSLSPAAVNAFNYKGDQWGIPHLVSQVGFWYNKELFSQAGVNADDIKTWPDLLTAVQTLKDAGITPMAVGGGDQWPLHFYYTHLAIRVGGKQGFLDATSGEGDGFSNEIFVKAGELFQQLTEMEPYQNGFLGATYGESSGYFGDGNAAMHFQGNWDYNRQKTSSVSKEGIVDDNLGWFAFPEVEGGAGAPTDTLGGINGWLFGKDAPDEAIEFIQSFVSMENQTFSGANGHFIPVAIGSADGLTNPYFKQISENVAASDYHQIFYDQMLGPDVGRVVNEVSTDLAAGTLTPQEAADTIQQAWEDAN